MTIANIQKVCTTTLLRQFRIPARSVSAVTTKKSTDILENKPSDLRFGRKGVWVAGYENYSPLSRVAVVFKAGSRYENYNQLGATHALREASSLGSKDLSSFRFVRNVEQLGCNFTCTSTRELLIYSVEVVRDYLAQALELLNGASVQSNYKVWDFPDVIRRMKLQKELFYQSPEKRITEALHEVAFTDTLGRSLYAKKPSTLTPQVLYDFLDANCTSERTSLIGVGCGYETLEKIGSIYVREPKSNSVDTSASTKKSRYVGGEWHEETGSPVVHTILASKGVSHADGKECLAAAALQRILGMGSSVDNSYASSGLLSKAASPLKKAPFAVSAINLNYSDNGLFGFHLVSRAPDTGRLLEMLVTQYKDLEKVNFTDVDLTQVKAQLKLDLCSAFEEGRGVFEFVASQLFLNGNVATLDTVMEAVDSLTAADLSAVAKKILSSKFSMTSSGKLSHVPRLADLV